MGLIANIANIAEIMEKSVKNEGRATPETVLALATWKKGAK